MPTAAKPRPKKKAPPKQSADGAVERVSDSLEAAQKALNAVRGDVSQGSRDLMANVERLIKDARRTSRSSVSRFARTWRSSRRTSPARAAASRSRRASGERRTCAPGPLQPGRPSAPRPWGPATSPATCELSGLAPGSRADPAACTAAFSRRARRRAGRGFRPDDRRRRVDPRGTSRLERELHSRGRWGGGDAPIADCLRPRAPAWMLAGS